MRILTWNAKGDSLNNAEDKLEELKEILEYWEGQGDTIVAVCLQEVNGSDGLLSEYLSDSKPIQTIEGTEGESYYRSGTQWDVYFCKEQANGKGNDCVIALRKDLDIFKYEVCDVGTVPLHLEHDKKGIDSKPSRNPFYVYAIVDNYETIFMTWHATLGSRQLEDFVNLSGILNDEEHLFYDKRVLLAADMNQTEEILNGGYYSGFTGFSSHLDHILGRGFSISEGNTSSQTNSDHLPVSADFDISEEE